MVGRGAATTIGGVAIPADIEGAGYNSSRTRLKRAVWKKRRLAGAPTELRLGRWSKSRKHLAHLMFQKSNYTFHTLQRPGHVSDQEEKEEKKW